MNDSTRYGFRTMTRLLTLMVCWLSLTAQAQEKVTVMLNPVQQVLPPQAGRYISDPGKFFKVWLVNNTDEQQLVHLGLQIEQRFPNQELWVSTHMESGHIPQRPIVLAPNQQKLLNAIEMRHLFDHFTKSDVFIKDGRHLNVTNGDYGLLPEGEYEAFLTAYKWDPELTSPVVLSDPSGGNTLFNICYEAEAPKFLSPVVTDMDGGLGELKVVKLNKNLPISFTWIAPTLNCNAPLVNFEYAVRIVELGSLMPDEAMHTNTQTFLERKNLISTTFTVNQAYTRQMIEEGQAEGKIYALQVTATTPYMNDNSIYFSLIKNEGKSPILLFQLYDPDSKVPELADVPQGGDGGGGNDNGGGQGGGGDVNPNDDGGGYSLSLDDVSGKYDDIDDLYVFSQPKLISPSFSGRTYRTVYLGENIDVEWRKAWFEGGRGLEQEKVEFEYTINLYTGNTADDAKTIFNTTPIYTKDKIKECNYTLDWTDVDYDFGDGTYIILRVTATPTNEESVRMLPDEKNYVDFVLTNGYEETFECGESTADVDDTTPITTKPASNATLHIGAWDLTFDANYANVKLEDGLLKGTGWISWPIAGLNARIAVEFEDLKVNAAGQVFEGTCKTRGNPTTEKENVTINGKSYSPDEIAKSLFEEDALNDIFGLSGLPAELQEKVQNEGASLAQSYNIGKYYSMYKKAENLWTSGTLADLYFPLSLPKSIKDQLPKDFDIQIADMTFTPTAAIMNVIAEIVMPNSDVFEGQQVLVFGAPRLCVQPDRILPEDGVIALLSNFPIKDPTSEFVLTFKAPTNPLDPVSHDGCFIRWENDEFDALGLEIAMLLPNTKRIINGQTQDDIPALLDLYATIEKGQSAVNFLAEGTLTPFEVTDLPGWKFANDEQGSGLTVIFDHNTERNGDHMPSISKMDELYPNKAFDPRLCGSGVSDSDTGWNHWVGVYINNLNVEFPKFAVFGNGDEGLKIGAQHMLIDASGITCKAFSKDILNAETGSCGGWAFSVSNATVDIVQNNFDNCQIDGSFGVPLLGKAAQKKAAEETKKTKGIDCSDNSGKDDYKDIDYHCEIRHLTAMEDVNIEKWNAAGTQKETTTRRGYKNNRLAYVFSTDNSVGVDLTLNFVLGNLTLKNEQTYFLVESIDDDPDKEGDQAYTQVELCMAGDISIIGSTTINEKLDGLKSRFSGLAKILEDTKLPIHMPGIHFAKMRLSNKKEADWRTDLGLDSNNLHQNRLKAQENWLKNTYKMWDITSGEEVELSKDECYFNYGEWSLASERKKIGPFSFNLKEFKPKMDGDRFSLNINGDIGLVEDKICVGGDIAISADLHKEGGFKNIKNWYLSDGDFELKELSLDLDFTMLHFFGKLNIGSNDEGENGYAGELDITIKELFELKCTGGYYNHKASNLSSEEKEMLKADDPDFKDVAVSNITDVNYSWGYFTISVASEAGLRFDPVVINRISGGFYFNCKPLAAAAAEGKKSHEFVGTPKGQYGMIGVAFGLGMSTSAGEKVLKLDADMLVVYDRQNKCLSAFKFYGGVEAVGSLIKADVTLVYVNDKNSSGVTLDRYLSLNMTMEAGWTTKELENFVGEVNDKLKELKGEFDKFSSDIKGLSTDPKTAMQGLKRLSGKDSDNPPDYNALDNLSEEDSGETVKSDSKTDKEREDLGLTAMRTKVQLEFMVTWVKNKTMNTTPKWHLYLGEPTPDKRCTFTYIDFDSKICSAHIGADGYICVGNELPNNGELPPIPDKISEFLSGHKYSNADMGADEAKVARSRMSVVKGMLNPGNINGGVMVGASAWGDISIDLGLLKGSLGATAGFDAALVNYGNSAFCMNNGSTMGYKGWYATGQLYAYLWANLGVHIDLGALYEGDIWFFDAGIGGVLEVGLPHPSWVEGQARIKMEFLGGLFKVNKKFHFSAGGHCIPFRGNALDGFSLFSGVNMGSDSLYQALCRPEFAISKGDVSKMIVSTNASLGSHYRLIDPTYVVEMAKNHFGLEESEITDEIRDSLSLQASRTYVFDLEKRTNDYGKLGVRLVDLGKEPTNILKRNPNVTEEQFYKECSQNLNPDWRKNKPPYDNMLAAVASRYYKRENTIYDGSCKMSSYNINDIIEGEIIKENTVSRMTHLLVREVVNGATGNTIPANGIGTFVDYVYVSAISDGNSIIEKTVNFREDKGQNFHLCDMDVEKGHSYALILTGTAYEINNGERMWCEYVRSKNDKMETIPMKWNQEKIWFFRVKDDDEDMINKYELSTLEPYVALAYPSVDGVKVQNDSTTAFTAYYNDIKYPNIALNRDLTNDIRQNELKWTLTAYQTEDFETNPEHKPIRVQTRNVKYLTNPASSNSDLNKPADYVNIVPESWFDDIKEFNNLIDQQGKNYDFSNELYHLQLGYTYKAPQRNADGSLKRHNGQSWAAVLETDRDTTVYLVDLWMTAAPHRVNINGSTKTDSWLESTSPELTGDLLDYVEPFVGVSPSNYTVLDYDGMNGLTDDAIVFNNLKYNSTPMRLLDPWLYLAYLSKWTFVGDHVINSYAFDNVPTLFASESLIYDYNSSVINSDFIKGDYSKSLWELRNDMFNTWNDWHYNNAKQPEWPLPSTLKTIGGITAANQNGRVSTFKPLNLRLNQPRALAYSDLLWNFDAPYVVASHMSADLKEQARTLYDYFAESWSLGWGPTMALLFDQKVQAFNNLHRGHYLEYTYRGVTAKVPYYQLPLIFGGCFSNEGILDTEVSAAGNRTFYKSIGLSDDVKEFGRWNSANSSLLFFRLIGNEAQPKYDNQPIKSFRRNNWLSNYQSYPYPDSDKEKRLQVEYDEFNIQKARSSVFRFYAHAYRVDSYNMSTGEYVMLNRGAYPHEDQFNMGKDGIPDEWTDALGMVGEEMNPNLEEKYTYAIWTESDKTLTLLYSDQIYERDGMYGGKTITDVWRGDNFMRADRHKNIREAAETVVIDWSMRDATFTDLSYWFKDFKKVKEIWGFEYLNWEYVTNVSHMFENCELLTKLNLSTMKETSWNITDMSSMFENCKSLKDLSVWFFNTQKVVDMSRMFKGCEKVEDLPLSNFTSENLLNTKEMFAGCKNLKKVYIYFEGKSIKDCSQMFAGCPNLVYLDIEDFAPEQVDDCTSMFTDVTSDLQIHISYYLPCDIQAQIPSIGSYMKYTTQAIDVSSNVKVKNHPMQALYCKNNSGEYELHFIKDRIQYEKGDTYRYSHSYLSHGLPVIENQNLTVEEAWRFDDFKDTRVISTRHGERHWDPNKNKFEGDFFMTSQVSSTNNSIPWENVKATIKRVVFEESFASESSQCKLDRFMSTRKWFSGCSNLVSISGLEYLITEYVQDMKEMFAGCKNLQDFTIFEYTSNVTDMEGMFKDCQSLTTLDLSSWLTWKVEDMSNMFSQCRSLRELNLERWNTTALKSCGSMFYQVPKTCYIRICNSIGSKIYTAQLDKTNYPYLEVSNCTSRKPLREHTHDFTSKLGVAQVIWTADDNTLTFTKGGGKKVGDDFNGHTVTGVWSSEEVTNSPENEAPGWTKTITRDNKMEAVGGSAYGKAVKVVIDESFSSVQPHSTSYWFQLGSQMKTIEGLQYLNTSEVESMNRMFATCGTTLLRDMNFNTSKVKSMEGMFADCRVSYLNDITSFNTDNVTNMANMFNGCNNLQSLDLSNFKTQHVTDMTGMFRNCNFVKELDLLSFDLSNVREISYMFNGCTILKTMHIKDFDLTSNAVKNSMYVFNGLSECRVYVHKTEEECPNLRYDFSRMGFSSETGEIAFFAPQVIWTEDSHTLTFVSSLSGVIYTPGENYNGQTVTAVWSGSDITNTPVNDGKAPWTDTVKNKLTKVVIDQSFSDVRPKSTAYWFAMPRISESSDGGSGFDPNKAYEGNNVLTNNYEAFTGLEYLNTSEVTDMTRMFNYCRVRSGLDLSHFNTEKVTSMNEMFAGCLSLNPLNFASFNTSNVTNMQGMFYELSANTLDISDFNTNKVTNADRMFSSSSISNLKVGPDFQFKNMTTKAQDAFLNVKNMKVSYDPKSTTDNSVAINVENAMVNKLGFIDGTNGQLRLDLSDKPQVIWTESNKTLTFFYGGKVYVGDTFNGYTVTNVWSDAQVTNSSQTGKPDWAMTVSQKIARKTIIVPAEGSVWGAVTKVVIDESFSLVKPNSTRSWFDLNNQLTTISGLENLNTENVETMDYMFSGYGGASLNVSNLNTSKVKSMRLMFSNSSLTNLDLSNFGTSNVTDMSNMFANCAELQTLTFSDKFKTQKVTSMSGLFSGCNKINNLDITSFDMTNVTNVDYMFENCTGLKNMKMLYFNVGSNVNGINVFRNVTGLTVKVDLREEECTNLKSTLSKLGFTSTTGTIEFKKVELRPFNPRF